jgi:hypothetical protein
VFIMMRGVSKAVTDVPELTTAGLAGLLGISERRVAAVRGEGRLPMTPDGRRIDGRELLRRGWAASLAGQWPGVDPADAEPGDIDWLGPVNMARVLREVAIAAVLAAAELGLTRPQAERLADLVALIFWGAMNEPLEAEGLPEGIHADAGAVLAWRERVNWSTLFGPDGESLVAGQIETASRAELGEPGIVETAGRA